MKNKSILKYKDSNGKCSHKRNYNGNGKIDCIPEYCPYMKDCLIEDKQTQNKYIREDF